MDPSTRFRVNSPSVIGESIDGELLIVNLDSGAYFSARGAGELIWKLATQGTPVGDVAASAVAAFEGDEAAIRSATMAFVEELVSEGLIVLAPDGAGPSAAPSAARGPFAPPILEKFTDMQELLILDPVHEVEQTGWPHALPDAAAAGDGR